MQHAGSFANPDAESLEMKPSLIPQAELVELPPDTPQCLSLALFPAAFPIPAGCGPPSEAFPAPRGWLALPQTQTQSSPTPRGRAPAEQHRQTHRHELHPRVRRRCTRGSQAVPCRRARAGFGRQGQSPGALPGEELGCRGPTHMLRYTWLQSFSKVSLLCSSRLMSWKNCFTSASIS